MKKYKFFMHLKLSISSFTKQFSTFISLSLYQNVVYMTQLFLLFFFILFYVLPCKKIHLKNYVRPAVTKYLFYRK